MNKPVILRARWTATAPLAGTLLAARRGEAVFGTLAAVGVRKAARRAPPHFPLPCTRLKRADVPEGAMVAPWQGEGPEPVKRAQRPGNRHTADPGPPETPAARLARI